MKIHQNEKYLKSNENTALCSSVWNHWWDLGVIEVAGLVPIALKHASKHNGYDFSLRTHRYILL